MWSTLCREYIVKIPINDLSYHPRYFWPSSGGDVGSESSDDASSTRIGLARFINWSQSKPPKSQTSEVGSHRLPSFHYYGLHVNTTLCSHVAPCHWKWSWWDRQVHVGYQDSCEVGPSDWKSESPFQLTLSWRGSITVLDHLWCGCGALHFFNLSQSFWHYSNYYFHWITTIQLCKWFDTAINKRERKKLG